jgi:citrate synthase
LSSTQRDLVPGLAGIPAAESAISFIDGQAGVLEYRGIPIEVLAERSSFEETAWLLLRGELPTEEELAGWRRDLAAHRTLSPAIQAVVASLPREAHPMEALQALVAALGMEAPNVDLAAASTCEEACRRLLAATPVLVAAFERHRQGLPAVAPAPDLDTAANFLWMVTGERPAELAARVLDVALVLHADHTMNASTFAARVVASTETSPYSVCSAAVGSLYGPLHGGANERVLQALEEIGGVDYVPAWFAQKRAAGAKIMGFGHRVYKVKDPRSLILQGLARRLFDELGTTPIYDVALRLEEQVLEHLGDKGIYPNVDFYSGIVYQKLGIPTDLFTPVFAIARTAGWLAHWREQMADNKLFRPVQIYSGGHGGAYVELENR